MITQLDCPLCKKKRSSIIRRLQSGHSILVCQYCGAKFCDPFVGLQPEFYAKATDRGSEFRHSTPTCWDTDHPTRRSSLFASEGGNGRLLLDIGCGNGAFAAFAASCGYQVWGIDVDAVSVEIARSRKLPDVKFTSCSLEEFYRFKDRPDHLDVVTMFEVFEHLENPVDTMHLIKQLLPPGGLFVGSLPNVKRPFMWNLHMDYEMPPYHLTYWTVRDWSRFLSHSYGFEILQCKANIYFGYLSDVLLSRYRLPSRLSVLISRLVRPIEAYIEKHFHLGASFYFVAKRGRD